jgi:putative membrane protein
MNTMPVDKDDADFAVKAANGGMMEVQLGNYAQQNAVSKRVKDFGAMMVKDHTKANEELKSIAAAKNITLPTSIGNDAQKDMDDMMKKKGNDFDKAYMNMMLDDHKKDVKEFEKAAKDCKDAEIKTFAGKTLPVLLAHLDSTKAITGKH